MKSHLAALIIALILLTGVAGHRVVAANPTAARASVQVEPGREIAPDAIVKAAAEHAHVIVRARVVGVTSFWSPDHTQILSQSRLEIRYRLRGTIVDAPLVTTTGGHLPDENLSMVVSDEPLLREGEEVILFLSPSHRPDAGYKITGGHGGKFVVAGEQLHYSALVHEEPLETFYARLYRQDASAAPPADWRAQEATVEVSSPVVAADFVYNGKKWFVNTVEFKVNLNSTQMDGDDGAPEDFLQAITNAATTWSMVEEADFTLQYAGPTTATGVSYNRSNDIFFEDRGQVDENGVRRPLAVASVFYSGIQILDNDIWINDAYDWDTTGSPDRAEIDLESVLLHEFGHWLALGHDSDSQAIMYYAITAGSLKRVLHANDRNGIAFIYPCNTDGGCTPAPPTTPTPSPTATPTPTVTPTPTATPTITPTPLGVLITASEGGVIERSLTSGAHISLVVPPGAVLTDTVMAIEQVTVSIAPPDGYLPLHECFRIIVAPRGVADASLDLVLPAALTVTRQAPVAPAPETIRLMARDEADDHWQDTAAIVELGDDGVQHISTTIVHPATFGLFRAENRLYLPAVTR